MFYQVQDKVYISVVDCKDGLKGQELHDLAIQIIQARVQSFQLLNSSSNNKKILSEEINNNVDEYLEQKYGLAKRFQKHPFNLEENKMIEQFQHLCEIPASEIQELKDDLKSLKKLLNYYK